MMDWSDRHCRMFWRQLTQDSLLYTEMVNAKAILHGDRHKLLDFNAAEQPLALQLGGSEPRELAKCAAIAEQWGYCEVNLNCGCPSERVQSGSFGACLMTEPQLVAACVQAMRERCTLPVTVKHRIGIDDQNSYQFLVDFVAPIAAAGCTTFIVHARSAWLKGLSPKENREIPPLDYARVYQLKKDFPQLEIIINGGFTTLEDCETALQHVDGIMVGRAAYHQPMLLAEVDQRFFKRQKAQVNAAQALQLFIPYIEQELNQGTSLNSITRHLLGLFQGVPGDRQFRRHLSEHVHLPNANVDTLLAALEKVTLSNAQS